MNFISLISTRRLVDNDPCGFHTDDRITVWTLNRIPDGHRHELTEVNTSIVTTLTHRNDSVFNYRGGQTSVDAVQCTGKYKLKLWPSEDTIVMGASVHRVNYWITRTNADIPASMRSNVLASTSEPIVQEITTRNKKRRIFWEGVQYTPRM